MMEFPPLSLPESESEVERPPRPSSAPCFPIPHFTQVPYFVDELLNRSDIRTDTTTNAVQPGLTMYVTVNVAQLSNCALAPFTGAFVDIWHCNALGVYSDVAQQSTTGRNFLRGYQTTDRHGNARFTTIYRDGIRAERRIFTLKSERSKAQPSLTNSRLSSSWMMLSATSSTL